MTTTTSKRVAAKLPPGTELIPIHSGVETWRNETAGLITVNRVGEYGRPVVDVIDAGRTFQVTPQERRMNQNACYSRELDIFTNGALRPIDLLEGEPDTELLRKNPNTFTDDELKRVFALDGVHFVERIGLISNAGAISRILELARDPAYGATLAQYEAIRARESALRGQVGQQEGREATGRPVTPR
jgi:hypothetical protein